MRDARRYKLLHGPYVGPRCRPGIKLFCEIRGWVIVGKMSEGRIAWPMCKVGKRARAFILCGDLVKAIQRESNIAVCYWWGVTAQTVTAWRKALGVPMMNEGTGRLYREYAPERLTVEARIKARKAMRFPDVREKIAAAKRGKPRPPHVVEAIRKANKGRPLSLPHREKIGEALRRRGHRPAWLPPSWSKAEDRLLRKMPDAEVARRTGRTVVAVRSRRAVLRIPSVGGHGPKMRTRLCPE
jgi:hypothetical protein